MIKNKNILFFIFFVFFLFLIFLYKNQYLYITYDTTKEGFIENMNQYTRPFIRFKNKYMNNYINKVNTMIQKINPFK